MRFQTCEYHHYNPDHTMTDPHTPAERSFIGMEECELLEKCLRWQMRHQSWKIKYKALLIVKVIPRV